MPTVTTPSLSLDAQKLRDLLFDIGGSVALWELAHHTGWRRSKVAEVLIELEEAGLARATYFEGVR